MGRMRKMGEKMKNLKKVTKKKVRRGAKKVGRKVLGYK